MNVRVFNWNEQTQLGKVFGSATILKLPSGSKRSPDVAWLERYRWGEISPQDRETFPPLAPDLAIELRSREDPVNISCNSLARTINNI